MLLLAASFLAGILTLAAPCILPLLPVIIGGSLINQDNQNKASSFKRPLIIATSLAVSVVLFTLLLKYSTLLLGIPQELWQIIAGGLIALIGLSFLVPHLWESLPFIARIAVRSNRALGFSARSSHGRDVLIGLSLGPVFNSCSPTYLFIVAAVLPVSISQGFIYLLAYAVGLALGLMLIALLGGSLIQKLGWAVNPNGAFKKIIGSLFLLVGLVVIFGIDKSIQAFVLEQGWYDPIKSVEVRLIQ